MLVKQRLYTKILMVVGFAVASVLMLSVASSAQQDNDTPAANTLRITPVRSDITADAGETKVVKVTVTNPSDFDVEVRPVQNDFVAGDEDGTPALILDEDEYAPTHSLKRFMKPIDQLSLPAGESKTVDVAINVPANAEAGGYFGALRFEPVAPDEGGQVNMQASVASLILLRVNGEVAEKLNLTNYGVQKNGTTGTFFNDDKDLSFLARFENDSPVQLAPFGKISVTKGSELVYETDFNDQQPQDMILPDSARRWSVPLNDIGGFGQYEVTATFTYGSKNQSIEVTSSFWIVPLWMIIAAAVLLVVLVLAVVWYVIKRRNSRGKVSLGSRRR